MTRYDTGYHIARNKLREYSRADLNLLASAYNGDVLTTEERELRNKLKKELMAWSKGQENTDYDCVKHVLREVANKCVV